MKKKKKIDALVKKNLIIFIVHSIYKLSFNFFKVSHLNLFEQANKLLLLLILWIVLTFC